MSRAHPFPTNSTRRARTPEVDDFSQKSLSQSVRPLRIGRQPSRPQSPEDDSMLSSSSRAGSTVNSLYGPSRPQRSELRSRQVSTSSNPVTMDRDSISARSDATRFRNGALPLSPMRMPDPLRSNDGDDPEKSPTSLPAVLSAFKSAGNRRRQMTTDSEELEYQRERAKEASLQKARQQRIEDRVPGRRPRGQTKAGDIDGTVPRIQLPLSGGSVSSRLTNVIAVLDRIQDEWAFVVDADFNSVDLALQLLDDSSLGKDMKSFRRTKDMLSRALKGSVDKHYQAFAAALPHHASLLNHLGATSQQITDARSALIEAKETLGSKRADLVQLWTRDQMLEEMLELLDQIDHLKIVPDLLETLMSEKRLLQASVLLVRSLKLINKPDMLEIGAVSDLRSYLVGQETALRDILIDELQSHLYLKSFWCESRWAPYVPNQQTFQTVAYENEPLLSDSGRSPRSQSSPIDSAARTSRLSRFLNDLALRPNDPPHDLEEPNLGKVFSRSSGLSSGPPPPSFTNLTSHSASISSQRNPESDSFAYMELLLESLAVLGKLGTALDAIAQRLPTEIFTLVESTVGEVAERAEYGRRSSMVFSVTSNGTVEAGGIFVLAPEESTRDVDMLGGQAPSLSAARLRLGALESSSKQADHETLREFFWTIYSKLDAVTQGFRVIYEVANRIGSRRDFKDLSGTKPGALFPLAEVWMPIQAEVRTLLYDYLTDEEQGTVSGRNPISSINEILREGKPVRDRSQPFFRFADADIKLSAKALKQHEDELTRVLHDTMPGLAQASSEQTVQVTLSSVGSNDRMLGVGQRHQTLVRPDAFHVTVLFQPTLAFLDKVVDILPAGVEAVSASSDILDEFVLRVYLPQLEEKVSMLFQQAVTGSDAFQPDPLSMRLSPHPLIKACTQLMALINSLCAMLWSTPFHRDSYSRLIVGVIIQFYQRCSDRFQDLVSLKQPGDSGTESRLALAAVWAQKPELSLCLSKLWTALEEDAAGQLQLCRQETQLELQYLGQDTVTKKDLIPSLRDLSSLASLYSSVAWFADQLQTLNSVQDAATITPIEKVESAVSATPRTPRLPTFLNGPPDQEVRLPLSREMGLRFHALLKTYEQLAGLILDTIRIDVRCRTLHYLDSAIRHGNYSIDREAGEPDPHVVDLNSELGQCDDLVSRALPKRQQQFVFVGIGNLMEHLSITYARHIRLPNAFGVRKIMRNVLALQQAIRTIANETLPKDFERVKHYYSLFFMSPQEMLESIRRKQTFTFDEYKTILSMQCGVDQDAGDAGIARATDRNYRMYVIDLHGLDLETPSEDQES